MKNYPANSKNLANGYLFILPLIVLYEVAITLSGSSVKNTADVIVKMPLEFFGRTGIHIFNLLIICFFFYAAFHLEKAKGTRTPKAGTLGSESAVHPMSFSVYVFMFIESVIYALLLGRASQFLVERFMPEGLSHVSPSVVGEGMWMGGIGLFLSIGAGVYEEIVFRLLLLSGLYFVLVRVCKMNDGVGGFFSIVIGATIFSSMHYIGPLSDTFTVESFLFRFMAGLILSTIFIFRGLGIVVYTHALYDVWIALKFG